VNESMNESVNKTANVFGFPDEPNDALAVLYGLTLALTAPDDTRAAKAADLVCDIYNRSPLTEQDLEALKAAAVVLVDYGENN
jgi:hypothetical protein